MVDKTPAPRHFHKPFMGAVGPTDGLVVSPALYGGFVVSYRSRGLATITEHPLAAFTNAHEAALWIEDAMTRHEFIGNG